MGEYRTIVADPPWPYKGSWGRGRLPKGAEHDGRSDAPALPYPSMSIEEICALPVSDIADPDGCHLYLWTTSRFLRDAFDVMEAWGFRYGQTVVWAKKPIGSVLGGAFPANVEFFLFGRCGKLAHKRRASSAWFDWKRQRAHSVKPDAMLDMVEETSPGPYLEMFARRERLGWDSWGDQSANSSGLALAA